MSPRSNRPPTLPILLALATVVALATPTGLAAQADPGAAPPSIEEKTAEMQRIDGFFPLHWDEASGRLFMEIPRFDTEVLYMAGLGSGLGSNDIGLDRARILDTKVVEFERVGPKVLMVQPNHEYRAGSDNPAEVRAVEDAFARSVVHGFEVAAEGGGRVLVDVTDFLLRDASAISQRLRPGAYRLERSRSAVYMPQTVGFPENTELEAELTYVRQPGDGAGGAGRFFEGVSDVAATGEAASLRVHHSFIRLPEDGYEPRTYDPRAGYGQVSWQDYAVPLDESMTQRFIRRHRLEKRDPSAAVSEPVEPIVYYLDPGVPEPVRSALLDGARWWNQAFEAAGYENAFRVELLPEDAHPLDIRYNVINWVHRSTRGWSYGSSVVDPRTGEIIKGAVALGSLRIRQDYMIAEGLLSPYEDGDETPPELAEWALARIRQLSAHEVGHTIGLGHNYYDSRQGRISVMDYPHPLVRLRDDGTLDHSEVYEAGIGEWDSVAVAYGYQDFPEGVDGDAELTSILDDAWDRDLIYLTNQDIRVTPRADQWANGTDPARELNRMLDVRRVALDRFGETAIERGEPLATMEEVLVPLYMHHRYQVTSAASALGGLDFIYALRGDGRDPLRPVAGADQREALEALARTLEPSELVLPRGLLDRLPPRPSGYRSHRELFPRYTGAAFDAVTPAVVAAEHTVANVLDSERAARLVEQHALDPELPGLGEVLDGLVDATFGAEHADGYEAEVSRAAERVLVDRLMGLAGDADMPQVRAVATTRLAGTAQTLAGALEAGDGTAAAADAAANVPTGTDGGGAARYAALAANLRSPTGADRGAARAGAWAQDEPPSAADAAHYALLIRDIRRFLEQPAESYSPPGAPEPPPGAPIGEPAMEWLDRLEPACSWQPPSR